MYIFFTFLFSSLIVIYRFKNSPLKWFSPALVASFMVSIYALLYLLFYKQMKGDISYKAFLCISIGLLGTLLGEAIFGRIRIRERNPYNDCFVIEIKRGKIYVYSIIMLGASLYKLYMVYILALKYGMFSGLIEMLSTARNAILENDEYIGGTIINQFIYVSAVFSFFCTYVFFHNYFVMKKKRYYYLLPLLPDFIFRLSTTNRSDFIYYVFGLIIIIIKIRVFEQGMKNPFSKGMILFVVVSFIVMCMYGVQRANFDISGYTLLDYFQAYTNGAIYDFSYYLENGVNTPPYFGYFTLKGK